MEFVAEPLDHVGDPAVVVGVFLAAAGRLGESVSDLGLHRFRVGLGAGVQRGGIAGCVPTQTRYSATEATRQRVKDLPESGPMRFLPEGVEEAGQVVAVGDLVLGGDV